MIKTKKIMKKIMKKTTKKIIAHKVLVIKHQKDQLGFVLYQTIDTLLIVTDSNEWLHDGTKQCRPQSSQA